MKQFLVWFGQRIFSCNFIQGLLYSHKSFCLSDQGSKNLMYVFLLGNYLAQFYKRGEEQNY